MPSNKPKRRIVRVKGIKIIPHLRKEPDLRALAEAALILASEMDEEKRLAKAKKAKGKGKAA